MTSIDITATINKPTNNLLICIKNNGSSIPIEIHPKEKIYTPELIFGHLLTGSNFDDSISSITGE